MAEGLTRRMFGTTSPQTKRFYSKLIVGSGNSCKGWGKIGHGALKFRSRCEVFAIGLVYLGYSLVEQVIRQLDIPCRLTWRTSAARLPSAGVY